MSEQTASLSGRTGSRSGLSSQRTRSHVPGITRRLAATWLGIVLVGVPFIVWAQEVERQERRPEREPAVELPPLEPAAAVDAATVSEIVERFRRLAAEELAIRRLRPRLAVSPLAQFTLSQAYETNPNLDSSHRSDFYTEEDGLLGVSFQYEPWQVTQDIGARFTNAHYAEFRDNNSLSTRVYSHLRWKPLDGRIWLDVDYELEDLEYPEDKGSTYLGSKVSTALRHRLSPWLFHRAGWSYEARWYDSRKTRDGAGNALDTRRADDRHRAFYEIGGIRGGTFLRVRQDVYIHSSNEAFQETYDSQVYGVNVFASTKLAERLQLTGSAGFQRKNYHRRPAVDTASYDDTYLYTTGLSFQLTPQLSAGYQFTRMKLDSNTPAHEYTNSVNALSLDLQF